MLTPREQLISKIIPYTRIPRLPQIQHVLVRGKTLTSDDILLDHDEHAYHALLRLEWPQLPAEIKHVRSPTLKQKVTDELTVVLVSME
jgi:hypothetical protein